MNKVLTICTLYILNVSAYNPGPQNNEFAHNPSTPGYGISNYFELLPDKIQPNKVVRTSKDVSLFGIKSVKLSGNLLRLELQKNHGQAPQQISLYSVAGKKVFQFTVPAAQSSSTLLIIPFPHMSKGVYFAIVETKTERGSAKLVYSGR